MFIECKQVVKAYRVADHELVALRGIDFEMDKGAIVAIVGPSGAGKSSLLNLLGGLDRPTAGKLRVGAFNLLELKRRALAQYRLNHVGFLWQRVERNLLPHRSAFHNVTLPMMLAGISPFQRRARARELLEAVGLGEHLHKKPAQLSGGMQQRVAIAVALANQPDLLLADEPTGALDRKSAAQVVALLQELRERYHLTILMVTHDMEMASCADRILTLRDGALGQELEHSMEKKPVFNPDGLVQLPEAAIAHLNRGTPISVEIRPEGVLLRPEKEEVIDAELVEKLPDAPRRRLFGVLRRGQV